MWDQRRARDERRSLRPVVFDAQVLLTSYLFFLNPDRPTGKINPKGKNVFTPYTILWLYNTKADKRPLFDFCGFFFNIFSLFCWDSLSAAETKTIKIDGTEDNCRVNRNYINSDTEELGGRNFYQNGFKKCIGIHTIHIQFTIHFSPSWYMIHPKNHQRWIDRNWDNIFGGDFFSSMDCIL